MSLLWKRAIGVKLLYAAGSMTVMGALIIRKIRPYGRLKVNLWDLRLLHF